LLEALNKTGKVLEFKELLAVSGLSRSAATKALKGMVVQGVVARVGRGKYQEVPLFAGEGA
jgi:DNA-binding IclR family transcriptional regulator